MLALADFLDTLLRGIVLAGVSLTVGGSAWALAVLRPWQLRAPHAAVDRALTLAGIGAVTVAAGQALLLALKALVLSESLGTGAVGDFALTVHAVAGATRVAIAAIAAGALFRLRRQPWRAGSWVASTAVVALLAASGAWLTHATGRLDHRPALMTLTALHQVSAAVWIGGLAHLAAYWLLARRDAAIDACWPELVARFSRLAAASVIALVVTALPLAWAYTGSASGLLGTGYGALVLTKVMLLGAALALALANRNAVRAHANAGTVAPLRTRLPYLVEGELIVGVMILFTAATLSGQPPAIDLAADDRASVGEVLAVFSPKVPSLRTPSVEVMRRRQSDAAGPEALPRSPDAYLWSNYSHNVAGLILLAMSLVALGGSALRPDGGRHWPLGFVALAAFVYLRASANEGTWPFGANPLWRVGAEGIQHRIAALLVLGLGMVEWRVRAFRDRLAYGPYVFPALAAAGAVLLLTHSHTAFQTKASFLVQVTHTTMGALAVIVVTGRWLELRLPSPTARWAGAAASIAMLAIALVLVFYQEANLRIPPR